MSKLISPLFLLFSMCVNAQFIRSELPTELNNPWEITMGPDGFLWITEAEGIVSRVNQYTGDKQVVYSAPDYFGGHVSEQWHLCSNPDIGKGTHGLALHPDFMNADSSFIYFVYSYNHLSAPEYQTKFKIVRLKWDFALDSVVAAQDLITNLPNGYDHRGGRLISATSNGINYLFFSVGDLGISEDNAPDCYLDQADNPNNFTQDPDSLNGKIHRFNMDGTIPFDNPIAGNSFYTRGHRNPQGLAYNPNADLIYSIEHGDRTDDEVNLLYPGMNYGWKTVRGYHFDGSYACEENYVLNYTPDPLISGDALIEPIHSWCTDTSLNGSQYNTWCTVAPSDGEYYSHGIISTWENSLVVVTLKDGDYSDREVHVLKLSEDGTSVLEDQSYFGEDQGLNGRLRDVTFSIGGDRIFLINNGGTDRDKITVYTFSYEPPYYFDEDVIYPNPSNGVFYIGSENTITELYVYNNLGSLVIEQKGELHSFSLTDSGQGIYHVKMVSDKGILTYHKILKL